MPAKVKILVQGYYFKDENGQERTCPTITLVQDEDLVMVVDPGILEDQQILIDALLQEGLTPQNVNMVGLTHSHIDHYKNTAMFTNARVLEYFGVWSGATVQDWRENFSENIQILKTPGHDYTCITFFVKAQEGVVAICGDVFWKENYPEIDAYASDLKALELSRKLVLKTARWIIPGHGPMYAVKSSKGTNGKTVANGKSKKGSAAKSAMTFCRNCKRPYNKAKDKCVCQEWLCYHCCECETDCLTCNCNHRR